MGKPQEAPHMCITLYLLWQIHFHCSLYLLALPNGNIICNEIHLI